MAITWGDLKGQVIDLGFEEDDIYTEYERIIINSVNRAVDVVYNIVVPQIENYYKVEQTWGYEDVDSNGKTIWVLPKPKRITVSTLDTDKVNLPDNLIPLIPLLASHYIWLDDDITKAVTYWNEYDQLKDQLIATCKLPRKSVIEGGW